MKVLIAIDGSGCSSAAVESVADRTWPEQTEFKVISVIEPIYLQYGFAGGYVMDSMIEAERQLTEYRRQLVAEKVAQLRKFFGNDQVNGQVLNGDVPDAIIDMAKNWQADLIVMGSHGRRGMQRFFLGSVAEKVATHCPCSIEIVKGTAKDEPMESVGKTAASEQMARS